MKIITWNVNGLRSVLSKGVGSWLASQGADVLCFQEIKTHPDKLLPEHQQYFQGYKAYWHPAKRAGYSGVVTFSRTEPAEVQIGMGIPYFDEEGRVIRSEHPGFTLFNAYFPNGQRDQGRLDYKLSFYEHLLGICDELHAQGKQVVICGDFNTAHREIDLRNPKANSKNSGFLPEERAWIDRYLDHGLVDPFRILFPERVQYTWWTYITNARQRNVGWRIDYFMVSSGLMPFIQNVVIHEEVPGSDHCPVALIMNPIVRSNHLDH